jgi:hypothetical protein
MKNSNDTIGNPTRDLPACSAVSQTTAPPRALFVYLVTAQRDVSIEVGTCKRFIEGVSFQKPVFDSQQV